MAKLLKPHMAELIEKAMTDELYASNKYKHLANVMQMQGMFGSQKFFEQESASEIQHYYELRDFVNDMGGDVIPVPEILGMEGLKISGVHEAIKAALETEQSLLTKYQNRAYAAMQEQDMACFGLFMKFVDKQVHSVGEYMDILARIELNPSDVFQIDDFIGEIAN